MNPQWVFGEAVQEIQATVGSLSEVYPNVSANYLTRESACSGFLKAYKLRISPPQNSKAVVFSLKLIKLNPSSRGLPPPLGFCLLKKFSDTEKSVPVARSRLKIINRRRMLQNGRRRLDRPDQHFRILVRHRALVQRVPADRRGVDSLHLLFVLGKGERRKGIAPAAEPSRSMGRRAVPVRVALPLADQAAIPHIQGDHDPLPALCGNGALPEDLLPYVDVVVDGFKRFDCRKLHPLEDPVGNRPAVDSCVLLHDLHVVQIVGKICPLQIGEFVGDFPLGLLICQIVIEPLHLHAKVPAAGMDDQAVAVVCLVKLDEVVPAAQRADAAKRLLPSDVPDAAQLLQPCLLCKAVRGFTDRKSGRDLCVNQLVQLLQLHVLRSDPCDRHPAADVDPYKPRGGPAVQCHGHPHGAPFSGMHIGHDADLTVFGENAAAQRRDQPLRPAVQRFGKDPCFCVCSFDANQCLFPFCMKQNGKETWMGLFPVFLRVIVNDERFDSLHDAHSFQVGFIEQENLCSVKQSHCAEAFLFLFKYYCISVDSVLVKSRLSSDIICNSF